MAEYYKNTVDLLKEYEFCFVYYKKIDKNNELKERIKFILNENQDNYSNLQWRDPYKCDDIYDINYLKNSLSSI